jgi:hypothetical protein
MKKVKEQHEKLIKQAPSATKGSGGVDRPYMTDEEIKVSVADGAYQCVVEAQSDGTICWDITDSREREPIHNVKKGDRFWCWNFKALDCGSYTHDYANMAPTNVKINTDVKLKLVYVAEDCQDPVLFEVELEKSPNVT